MSSTPWSLKSSNPPGFKACTQFWGPVTTTVIGSQDHHWHWNHLWGKKSIHLLETSFLKPVREWASTQRAFAIVWLISAKSCWPTLEAMLSFVMHNSARQSKKLIWGTAAMKLTLWQFASIFPISSGERAARVKISRRQSACRSAQVSMYRIRLESLFQKAWRITRDLKDHRKQQNSERD